jgi:hypothetical protein
MGQEDARIESRLHPREKVVLGAAALSLSLPVLLVSLAVSDGLIHGRIHLLPCVHQTIFHHECMTCGMTRSFGAMWKGNIRLASAYNLGGPPGFVAVWILFFMGVALIADGKRLSRRRNL